MKERLRILRKQLCLTQAEFGEKINIKANTVGSYEKGDRTITERAIADIIRVYGVDENWLRTGEGDMFPVPANSSGDEFAAYAKKLLESNSEVDQWTKDIIVRWCKLTPDRQRIFIHVLYDLFTDSPEQARLESLMNYYRDV